MEIKELQYFLSIVDAGSLSAASEKLYISQQGLSSAVHRLESELGYPLLTRSPSGIALTERGRAFYDGAAPIVASFLEFTRTMTDPSGRPAISISCTYNIISKCPRPMQRLLLNQDSDYSVETAEHYSSECEDMLENGQCSFGIVYSPFDETRFEGHTLFARDQCFIVNKRHPFAKEDAISIQQLKNQPLIIPHTRSRTNAVIRQLCKASGFEPRVVLECDRPMEILSLVKENAELIARMFEEDAHALNDPDITVLHFKDIDFHIKVCLIEKKRRALTPTERAVRSAILDCVELSRGE